MALEFLVDTVFRCTPLPPEGYSEDSMPPSLGRKGCAGRLKLAMFLTLIDETPEGTAVESRGRLPQCIIPAGNRLVRESVFGIVIRPGRPSLIASKVGVYHQEGGGIRCPE